MRNKKLPQVGQVRITPAAHCMLRKSGFLKKQRAPAQQRNTFLFPGPCPEGKTRKTKKESDHDHHESNTLGSRMGIHDATADEGNEWGNCCWIKCAAQWLLRPSFLRGAR